jgi:hypothetical protein
MRGRGLIRIIENALVYKIDVGCDDFSVAIDYLLEDVRKTLKCDPRLSRPTYWEFNVLFAAFADGARRLLGEYARTEWEYAAQHIDWGYAARMVTEAVIDEMNQECDSDDGVAP